LIDKVKIMNFEPNYQTMKNDIGALKDVEFLVDQFYLAVQHDPFIGPIFNDRLSGRWEVHHKKLYRFWHTVLLRRPDYYGDPVPIHYKMNIDERHFNQWLTIWVKIVDENFEGTIAERAKLRGKTMANAFLEKILRNAENERLKD
jgi:hemoglobin